MQTEGEVCKQKLRKLCKAFPSFLFPPSHGIHMDCNNGSVRSFLLDQISQSFLFCHKCSKRIKLSCGVDLSLLTILFDVLLCVRWMHTAKSL